MIRVIIRQSFSFVHIFLCMVMGCAILRISSRIESTIYYRYLLLDTVCLACVLLSLVVLFSECGSLIQRGIRFTEWGRVPVLGGRPTAALLRPLFYLDFLWGCMSLTRCGSRGPTASPRPCGPRSQGLRSVEWVMAWGGVWVWLPAPVGSYLTALPGGGGE